MEALKRFEEHFKTYGNGEGGVDSWGRKLVIGILVGFMQIFMASSVVSQKGTGIILECLFSFCAGHLFLNQFVMQQEEGRGVYIYKKLSYVPIGHRVMRKSLLKRLLRYVGKVTLVTVGVQVWILLVLEQPKMWWNLPYTVIVAGVLPLVTGMIEIYGRK